MVLLGPPRAPVQCHLVIMYAILSQPTTATPNNSKVILSAMLHQFYFAIFINMENKEKTEKKEQIVKQEPKQVALSDADLMAFIEDSTQAEFYNEPMANFIMAL